MRQILFVLLLFIATSAEAQKLKVFVTPHVTPPEQGELVNYSPQTVNSIRDVQNALKKEFILVSSRNDADFVVLIADPMSVYPQTYQTTILGNRYRSSVTTIYQSEGISIPLRRVYAKILVDKKGYETDVSGLGIWTWRSAAKAIALNVRTWASLNSEALREVK